MLSPLQTRSQTTDHHACILAHELTLAGQTGSLNTLGQALFDAQVDLNPHQIEAAVFALSNPQRRGLLLADEVGLGKTIEAGLVLAQHWAARKRRLCVVCPAHLRMQWATELAEKFHLPCRVVDARAYREIKSKGNPFDLGEVAVLSYAYAARMHEELRVVPFDLVVLDEAHKLRNAYKNGEKKRGFAAVRFAFELRRKLLLTATPIQNTLQELYGLGWVMDEHLFGSLAEFKHRYGGQPLTPENQEDLKQRLAGVCQRTLRSQVKAFVKYTERHAMTQDFSETATEKALHDGVMAYFQREESYGLPKRVRPMMGMLLCHSLASSPEAVAGTLATLKARVEKIRDGLPVEAPDDLPELLGKDSDLDAEELAEWLDEEDAVPARPLPDGRSIAEEIVELDRLISMAKGITVSGKSQALLVALKAGFGQMQTTGAARKALLFTESRRTQAMLAEFLERNGYAGKVACFNGDNTGPVADRILGKWRADRRGDDQVTGSRAVDIRSALVAHFRDEAEILIATEAGAEGVNLQFCSLVVNFDLPWNPQRIEQRIGRCHRYGQKHDVVVVNFLNTGNVADRRIHELLSKKFSLFDGLFGSSDEVLGTIESGVDFERRVLAILQSCRHPADIEAAFDQLQREMDEVIQARMAKARTQLLEHFDGEVHDRLNLRQAEAKDILDRMARKFWRLTQWGLAGHACAWHGQEYAFDLLAPPTEDIPVGHYRLRSSVEDPGRPAHVHRLQAPLGQWLISCATGQTLPSARIRFDLSGHGAKISALEPEIGKQGWLRAEVLEVQSDAKEQFLLVSAVRNDGSSLEPEVALKLFELAGDDLGTESTPGDLQARLAQAATALREGMLVRSSEAGNRRFQTARDQIQRWADEAIAGAERELDEIKTAITAAQRSGDMATTLEAQTESQKQIQELEKKRRRARERIYDAEDEVKGKRDQLIAQIKQQLQQRTATQSLFDIAWEIS